MPEIIQQYVLIVLDLSTYRITHVNWQIVFEREQLICMEIHKKMLHICTFVPCVKMGTALPFLLEFWIMMTHSILLAAEVVCNVQLQVIKMIGKTAWLVMSKLVYLVIFHSNALNVRMERFWLTIQSLLTEIKMLPSVYVDSEK